MFQAVRHWWLEGRGKPTARLFLFEFVVVVAGVLVAQALAGWYQDFSAARATREESRRVEAELIEQEASLNNWRVAMPCLRQRVDEILQSAVAGRPLPDTVVRRPMFGDYIARPVPPEMLGQFHERYGDRAQYFDLAVGAGQSFHRRMLNMSDQWNEFALLGRELRLPVVSVRLGVIKAALLVRRDLESMEALAVQTAQFNRHLGIPRQTGSPINSCAELWRSGRISKGDD